MHTLKAPRPKHSFNRGYIHHRPQNAGDKSNGEYPTPHKERLLKTSAPLFLVLNTDNNSVSVGYDTIIMLKINKENSSPNQPQTIFCRSGSFDFLFLNKLVQLRVYTGFSRVSKSRSKQAINRKEKSGRNTQKNP